MGAPKNGSKLEVRARALGIYVDRESVQSLLEDLMKIYPEHTEVFNHIQSDAIIRYKFPNNIDNPTEFKDLLKGYDPFILKVAYKLESDASYKDMTSIDIVAEALYKLYKTRGNSRGTYIDRLISRANKADRFELADCFMSEQADWFMSEQAVIDEEIGPSIPRHIEPPILPPD